MVEAGLVTGSHVRSLRINLYYFWLGSHVLLTKSNLSDQYFVDWLRCHSSVAGYHTKSRDVLVNGFELFWNLLLIKSSIANSTPPMWFHFPFPRRSRPVGYVHAAPNTSQVDENSRTAL